MQAHWTFAQGFDLLKGVSISLGHSLIPSMQAYNTYSMKSSLSSDLCVFNTKTKYYGQKFTYSNYHIWSSSGFTS